MDPVRLRIGGKVVSLTKSPDVIGVRGARDLAAALELAPLVSGAKALPQHIGGFRLMRIDGDSSKMESALNAMRLDHRVTSGTHVYHTSKDAVPFVPTGEIYVSFDPNLSMDECQRLLDQHALQVVQARGERELVVRTTDLSSNPIKVAHALQATQGVELAEPDLATPGRLKALAFPVSDPLLARQWHLRNTGLLDGSSLGLKSGADSRVVDAWQRASSMGVPQVVVAVIDDGFDLSHPDLSGLEKVVAPWDFTRSSVDPRPEMTAVYPRWDANSQSWQGDWHGTACAAVAVAPANGTGVVGAAPDCRLMPVRWGIELSARQIEAWFDYVRTQGAAVVSCSWGASASVYAVPTLAQRAITRCATEGREGKGCVICFAAGNSNRDINDPAGHSLDGFAVHPHVMAIAACTSRDERAHYSNFGREISVCAPSSGAGGRGVLTADVTGSFVRGGQTIEAGYGAGAYTDDFGGTSSATPLVAGVCALLLSLRTELTGAEVRALIESTARRIGLPQDYDGSGHSVYFGHGCVDALAAVDAAMAT
jgi:subtilisin family serine protease